MTPLCVDIKSAAAALGVSVWTLREFISEGLLPTVKLPSTAHLGERNRRVLILVSDLEIFAQRYRAGGAA